MLGFCLIFGSAAVIISVGGARVLGITVLGLGEDFEGELGR